ncbi:MAG: chemotaxis protein CheW [Kofleriaceae bacterium]
MSELGDLVKAAARAPATAAGADVTRPHVGLHTGARWFAVAAVEVAEVVAFPAVTRVPAAPAHVLGVAMVRTRLVPVLDLEHLVSARPTPRLERGRAVVVRIGDREAALVATVTRGMIALTDGDQPEPPTERPVWIAREVGVGDALYAVLDVATLLDHALGHRT